MKVTYNAADDMVRITFSDGIATQTLSGDPFQRCGGYVVMGFDDSDRIVRIDIHSASTILPPDALAEIMKAAAPT